MDYVPEGWLACYPGDRLHPWQLLGVKCVFFIRDQYQRDRRKFIYNAIYIKYYGIELLCDFAKSLDLFDYVEDEFFTYSC